MLKSWMAFMELRRKSSVSFFVLASFVQMGVRTVCLFKILRRDGSNFFQHVEKTMCINSKGKEKSKLFLFNIYLSHSVTKHVTQIKVNLHSNNLSYDRTINSSKATFVTTCSLRYPLFSINSLVFFLFFTSLLSLLLSLIRELI